MYIFMYKHTFTYMQSTCISPVGGCATRAGDRPRRLSGGAGCPNRKWATAAAVGPGAACRGAWGDRSQRL